MNVRSFVSTVTVFALSAACLAQSTDPKPPAAPPTGAPPTVAPKPPVGQTPTTPATEGAKLQLSSTEWDFGEVWSGQPAETVITLTNVGTAPLHIERVQSSCGCTVAKPSKEFLQPGESDQMKVSYNTKKRATKVSQNITLFTDDPNQRQVGIHVKGSVKPLFASIPEGENIAFGRVTRESNASQTLELRNNWSKPIKLKMNPITSDAFDIKVEEVEAGNVYRITATTKPPLGDGMHSAQLQFETGLPEYPMLNVDVRAFVQPRISVAPNPVIISPKFTKPIERTVRVTVQGERPIKILEVKSSLDSIKTALLPPRPNAASSQVQVHEIRVSLPPADELPDNATVTIMTDDPDPEYQKLVVNVTKQSPVIQSGAAAKPQLAPGKAPAAPGGQPAPGSNAPAVDKPAADKPAGDKPAAGEAKKPG